VAIVHERSGVCSAAKRQERTMFTYTAWEGTGGWNWMILRNGEYFAVGWAESIVMAREAATTTCREAEALLSSVAYADGALLHLT
jgi:hypothetical protein